MKQSRQFVSVTVALGLLFACGGENEGGTAPVSSATDYDEACDQLVNSSCTLIQRCMPRLFELSYGSQALCMETARAACRDFYGAPGIGAQPADISQCINARNAASCEEAMQSAETLPGCDQLAGTLADGAPCWNPLQCESLNCTATSLGSDCGVCKARVPAGAECASTSDCQPGLQCANTAAATNTRICTTPVSLGGACVSAAQCGWRASCANGVCTTMAGIGEACSSSGPSCDLYQGLTCSNATNTCAAIAAAKVGEACGSVGEAYAMCSIESSCASNVCVKRVAAGGACDESSGLFCNALDECVNGVCVAFAAPSCQ